MHVQCSSLPTITASKGAPHLSRSTALLIAACAERGAGGGGGGHKEAAPCTTGRKPRGCPALAARARGTHRTTSSGKLAELDATAAIAPNTAVMPGGTSSVPADCARARSHGLGDGPRHSRRARRCQRHVRPQIELKTSMRPHTAVLPCGALLCAGTAHFQASH